MNSMNTRPDVDRLAPWPLQRLRERLLEGVTLYGLTGPKRTVGVYDVRENTLEAIFQQVMVDTFDSSAVEESRRSMARMLDLPNTIFPASAMPDIVIHHGGKVHILEVKSSRTDYNRFDSVVSSGIRQFLVGIGEGRVVPTEVEQDLMRLLLYPGLTDEIGSCLFMMVDAYDRTRGGKSWTAAFSNPHTFRKTMKTKFVQAKAEMLVAATTIEELTTADAAARLITCLVHPWVR